ncbi:MAG: LPS assembly lipoprotein LptE [Victivallales bacterium]|nr:LPS assembly lipoprotein LptE [Victivallales bacterium]
MKKLWHLLTVAVIAGVLGAAGSGCGYHIGSTMHPQIKSIYIEPVVNDTLIRYVAAEMRGMLSEQFVVDGSLKVKKRAEADCLLYCRVTDVTIVETTQQGYDDNRIYRTAEWTATVTAEFTVIIPTRKEPLISKRVVSGSALFQAMGDKTTMESRGIRQACHKAARQVVEYTTEGW